MTLLWLLHFAGGRFKQVQRVTIAGRGTVGQELLSDPTLERRSNGPHDTSRTHVGKDLPFRNDFSVTRGRCFRQRMPGMENSCLAGMNDVMPCSVEEYANFHFICFVLTKPDPRNGQSRDEGSKLIISHRCPAGTRAPAVPQALAELLPA